MSMLQLDIYNRLVERIFNLSKDNRSFEEIAIEVFWYQYQYNSVYKKFVNYTFEAQKIQIRKLSDIPFLPIDLYKTYDVLTASPGQATDQRLFLSSGTTGQRSSKHIVSDITMYNRSFLHTFESFYGDIESYCILGLLPSYLERKEASLVYMVRQLMTYSKHPDSQFYLYNYDALIDVVKRLKANKQKIIIIGVAFALLDVAEKHSPDWSDVIIIETGGMKGKRKEIIRPALHRILTQSFGVTDIHSEYGMTELLSQAYAQKEGHFYTPAWMQVMIRELYDPKTYLSNYMVGALNIIDLANINSCSFIATSDLGKTYPDRSFEVLGRVDSADIRGCNLMY